MAFPRSPADSTARMASSGEPSGFPREALRTRERTSLRRTRKGMDPPWRRKDDVPFVVLVARKISTCSYAASGLAPCFARISSRKRARSRTVVCPSAMNTPLPPLFATASRIASARVTLPPGASPEVVHRVEVRRVGHPRAKRPATSFEGSVKSRRWGSCGHPSRASGDSVRLRPRQRPLVGETSPSPKGDSLSAAEPLRTKVPSPGSRTPARNSRARGRDRAQRAVGEPFAVQGRGPGIRSDTGTSPSIPFRSRSGDVARVARVERLLLLRGDDVVRRVTTSLNLPPAQVVMDPAERFDVGHRIVTLSRGFPGSPGTARPVPEKFRRSSVIRTTVDPVSAGRPPSQRTQSTSPENSRTISSGDSHAGGSPPGLRTSP